MRISVKMYSYIVFKLILQRFNILSFSHASCSLFLCRFRCLFSFFWYTFASVLNTLNIDSDDYNVTTTTTTSRICEWVRMRQICIQILMQKPVQKAHSIARALYTSNFSTNTSQKLEELLSFARWLTHTQTCLLTHTHKHIRFDQNSTSFSF